MMRMGVPYDLYWFGDPFAVGYYATAYELEVEEKRNTVDFTAWLTGAYVHEAVNASLSAALSKTSKVKYPKEPHTIVETRHKKQVKAEVAVVSAFDEFAGIAAMYNARRQKLRGGAEDDTPAS